MVLTLAIFATGFFSAAFSSGTSRAIGASTRIRPTLDMRPGLFSTMNTAETFGLFYKFSYLLMVPGMALSLYRMHRERRYGAGTMVFLQLFCGLILCALLQETCFSRVNIMRLPMTYFLCVGAEEAVTAFKDKANYILAFVYAVSSLAFFGYYLTDYDDLVAKTVDAPLREALAYTDTIRDDDDTICALSDIGTPLFLLKLPT